MGGHFYRRFSMLYLVKIGSIKNDIFYEVIIKAVSSEQPLNMIQHLFERKYEGLEVKVERIELVPETVVCCAQSYIEDIWVKYTDEEQAMHDEWKTENAQSFELRNDLERLIRERYKKLNYTAICARDDIILETDNEGTLIRHLPLKGDAFLLKVGEGSSI
jgi:hypothetical protein